MTTLAPKLERATLRTSRLLDFCSEKELVAQTGHAVHDWPLVVLKELVDTLCGSHDIPLLALHDFDKAGFSIVGTLQRDTRRYSFRQAINVIDVGLRMDDIGGLETEDVFTQSPVKARANLRQNGATDEEIAFLLDQRVELNAFASDDLVAWIEGKLKEHGVAKVVPAQDIMATAYRRAVEQAFVQQKIDEVIDEARELGEGAEVPGNLRAKVERHLRETPSATWDSIVRDIAMGELEDEEARP